MWEILIKDREAEPYIKKLEEIAETLKNDPLETRNIGLMGGKIGVALFFFYYAKYKADDSMAEYAVELISEVFDEINNDFTLHTYAAGIAGIGWSIELLAKNGFLEIDSEETLSGLDNYLYKAMMYEINNSGHYDFLHGAIGIGTYFLSRVSNPESRKYVEELIDKLEEKSQKDDDGARKWLSILTIETNDKGYNLSLSHGISSIIIFLSKAIQMGIATEKATPLLNDSIRFLLKHRSTQPDATSFFPSWVKDDVVDKWSRLAWCYGDLGNALALLQAGRILGNKEWEQLAIQVFTLAAGRRDLKQNMVVDAGLCHGAAGIMHVFNRAYQETHIELFKETTLYWAQNLLEMAVHEGGYAGYKAWHTEKYGGWKCEPGLLEGITGIGLALIQLISDNDSTWDSSLYIS